jgi:phospholipid transport system transporter-binding protein
MSENASFSIEPDGHARLAGELTLDTVAALYQQSKTARSAGSKMMDLDLETVTRVDSSGLALLLEWQSIARQSGQTIRIRNAPEGLLSLTRLCEASGLMEFEGRTPAKLQPAGQPDTSKDSSQ